MTADTMLDMAMAMQSAITQPVKYELRLLKETGIAKGTLMDMKMDILMALSIAVIGIDEFQQALATV